MPVIEPPKAVLDASGRVDQGKSPDARPAIQAALDAQNIHASGTWDAQKMTSEPVVLAPGNYYIKPADGGPTLSVWRGVNFDAGNANIFARYPSSPTDSWCAIVAHSQSNLTIGSLVSVGSPPSSALTYDGIRIFQTDNGQWHNIRDTIQNFSGANIRLIGSYVNFFRGGRVRYGGYGMIHEPMGQGEAKFEHAYYSMPGVAQGEVQGSSRRGTDLWVTDMVFDSLKHGGLIARGSNTSTPGNIMVTNTLFEGIGGPAVFADKLSTVQLRGVRMEEVGYNGPMVDIRHCWGSVIIDAGHVDITGTRQIATPDGAGYAKPTAFYSVRQAEFLHVQPAYIYSKMKNLEYVAQPAGGFWRHADIKYPPALAGDSRTNGYSPISLNRFNGGL